MNIVWSLEADEDLENITLFVAIDNPDAAINQQNEILQQIGKLSGQVSRKGVKGRVKGTMELVILRTPYIAAYCVKGNEIWILRILHGSQFWPAAFRH